MKACLLHSVLLLLALWAVPAGAGEKKDPVPGKPADEKKLKAGDRDPEFLERVDRAIERGRAYILSKQRPDGSWQGAWFNHPTHKYPWGETALCLLAILKAGEERFSDAVEKGFKYLRRQPLNKTYEVSVLMMALEARWAKKSRKKKAHGSQPVDRRKMPKPDLEWMRECTRFLLEHREMSWRIYGLDRVKAGETPDTWHYPGPAGTTTDHSNTQLALLALKTASRCGIKILPEVWQRTLLHFIECQEKTGPSIQRRRVAEDGPYWRTEPLHVYDQVRGWCYDAMQNSETKATRVMSRTTGSMTAVGVACLALALSEINKRALEKPVRVMVEKAIFDGLAWLDHHWTVAQNPNHPEKRWHYYYLYGVERAAVLMGLRNIGIRDWYREGAEYLLKEQKGDGHWDDPRYSAPLNNTCFALLFLTKATVPIKTKITGGGHGK